METEKKSATLTIAWVILLLMGLLMILGAAASMYVGFSGGDEVIAGMPSHALAQTNPELPLALRGRRITAACYALTCGVLISWIAVTAFRGRQKWAWYALLCSVGLGSVLSTLRAPLMDYKPGMQVSGITLIVLLIALAISYRDFR